MARYTGKDLYIEWNNGTAVAMDADYRSVATNETADKVDLSAGHDVHKNYTYGQRDSTIDVELLDVDTASGESLWEAVAPQTEGTLTWAPRGTATGNPKRSVAAFVVKRGGDWKYSSETPVTISFQTTEVIADDTY